jgi:uncharacterized protein YrrD
MLHNLGTLTKSAVQADDGAIGKVTEVFFDDAAWVVRYLVVDTGPWLNQRKVLISPYAVRQPVDVAEGLSLALSRQQVRDSPDIDTHQPVSRQHEEDYLRYYAYPEYWGGVGMWGSGARPLLPPYLSTDQAVAADQALQASDAQAADPHLRSSAEVAGYDIQASDGSIGHVEDFIIDDETFALRYLVVDTRNWWPGGAKVLVSTRWIDRIVWGDDAVYMRLTRAQIRESPPYEVGMPLQRAYEAQVHAAHERPVYWD